MHQAKKVLLLATAGKTRSPFAPDVPTFLEQGIDIEGSGWYGAFAPARTPAGIVEKLSSAMAAAVRAPELSERLRAFGLVATGTSAAELAAIQRADSERWAAAVKLSGFRVED
jgi:tripartite-type tricarboxylate transporter receptor subunit TctC